MNSMILDESKCIKCKKCYKACWLDVIRWDDTNNKPEFKYPEECIECNFCEVSCPTDAITIKIDYKKPFPNAYIQGKE